MPRTPNTPCAGGCGRLLWPTGGRRTDGQVCQGCRRELNPRPAPVTAWACAQCGSECERPPTRGQRPSLCVKCRGFDMPDGKRRALYERDGWSCGICSEPVAVELIGTVSLMRPSLDHIVPRSHGGSDDDVNLRLAHFICNARRGNRVAA